MVEYLQLFLITNNQLINNKTSLVDVTIDLGKEMIYKYNLECFKTSKKINPNLTFFQWKKENQEFIDQTEKNQLKFELVAAL